MSSTLRSVNMLTRYRLKITPDIVNEQFRTALDRYNKRLNGQCDHNEEAEPLTYDALRRAVRKLGGKT